MKKTVLFVAGLVFVAAILLGSFFWWPRKVVVREVRESGASVVIQSRLPQLEEIDREMTTLVDRVLPSVVSVTARHRSAAVRYLDAFYDEVPGEETQLGSGVIVSKEGLIITNLHVIQGTDRWDVTLNDGRVLPAKLLGADPRVDLAVLKVDAKGLRPLPFMDSDTVKVGQMVFAIGNPAGLQETVTQGIISGKGRRAISDILTEFFQTDAAINPGNSGGPLVNLRGELVGINNAVLVGTQGISFAIPSKLAARVLDDIQSHGKIVLPWIGIGYAPLATRVRNGNVAGGVDPQGLFVRNVWQHSPADRAGVRPGDILIAFNRKPLRDEKDLQTWMTEIQQGDQVVLRLLRDGKPIEVQVHVEPHPFQR